MSPNIHPFSPTIDVVAREKLYGHSRGLVWFTGLSGSGKSTIAHGLEARLHRLGVHSYVLDGDNIRRGLNKDLGLSFNDRRENIRRTAEVAKLMVDAGLFVMAAFITPYCESRRFIRECMRNLPFYECYIRCSIEVCEQRDPKGLYLKARQGEIIDFTGISAPFEEPEQPDIIINTDRLSRDEAIEELMKFFLARKLIRGLGER